jgi:hypothetical protein
MRDYNSVLSDLKNQRVQLSIEGSEHYEKDAHLYEGIFRVTIGHKVNFTFLPQFIVSDMQNLEIFDFENSIKSKNDARIYSLFTYKYIITPSENKDNVVDKVIHGLLENPISGDFSEDFVILYYVSNERFNTFSQEFYEIDGFEDENDRKIKNMIKYKFINFIIQDIITTENFIDSDYQWLLSGKSKK